MTEQDSERLRSQMLEAAEAILNFVDALEDYDATVARAVKEGLEDAELHANWPADEGTA